MGEALREAHLCFVVRDPLLVGGPIRVEEQRVAPELVREPETFDLRSPDGRPIAFGRWFAHAGARIPSKSASAILEQRRPHMEEDRKGREGSRN